MAPHPLVSSSNDRGMADRGTADRGAAQTPMGEQPGFDATNINSTIVQNGSYSAPGWAYVGDV